MQVGFKLSRKGEENVSTITEGRSSIRNGRAFKLINKEDICLETKLKCGLTIP